MTKFDELVDIITHNKNKGRFKANDYDDDQELEVAGSESSKRPLLSCGDDEMDGSIIDELYKKAKHKPNDGYSGESWDEF